MTIEPLRPDDATFLALLNTAVEADRVDDITTLDLPWVSILEPVVRDLDLTTILDDLLEDTVVVPDAIAPSW